MRVPGSVVVRAHGSSGRRLGCVLVEGTPQRRSAGGDGGETFSAACPWPRSSSSSSCCTRSFVWGVLHAAPQGIALAITSGAFASGVAYTFWYTALPGLTALRAALVQLTVPVLAALGAVVLLDERPSVRLIGAGSAVLGGVIIALLSRAKRIVG